MQCSFERGQAALTSSHCSSAVLGYPKTQYSETCKSIFGCGVLQCVPTVNLQVPAVNNTPYMITKGLFVLFVFCRWQSVLNSWDLFKSVECRWRRWFMPGGIHTQVCYNSQLELMCLSAAQGRMQTNRMRRDIKVVSTWPVGVALAESDVAEAHGAVAHNDKAGQAGELGVLHRHISRQVCKVQHQSIICTHAHHTLSAAQLPNHCNLAYTLYCICTW